MSYPKTNIIKFGNHKLGDDTLIFNLNTSADCPSRKLGLCPVVKRGIQCYAAKPEAYGKKAVIPYRKRQRDFWKNNSAREILEYFKKKIKARRKPTKYFRFNESGDFGSQEDIRKMSQIADGLAEIGVVTYGNTARSDLDFRDARFLVKGSGFSAPGLNGSTIVLIKDEKLPKGYIMCPATREESDKQYRECKKCGLCKKLNKVNVAYRKH